MKKLFLLLAILLLVSLLSACSLCPHQWMPATCTDPQYCKECGISNGEALGHDWVQISATERRCTRCGVTEVIAEAEPAPSAVPAQPTPAPAPTPAPTPVPTPTPVVKHWYDEHVEKMRAQGSPLVIPDDLYFLSGPETKTILGERGKCIYELYAPDKEAEKIGKIDNGTKVTVLARQNGYALFVTSGGLYAWGTDRLIVDEHDTPYLVSGKEDTGTAMVMSHTNKVYVLYDPYGIFPHMTTMDPGTEVIAYRTVNGFTYVETGSIHGWVNSSFLS